MFTNKCDNHYVDYLAGHAFLNVISVGNGCENGTISNIQCNTIAYACGDETKFGSWPNCELMRDDDLSAKAYGQNSESLDFMIIGDCNNEILYNNFLFGCHQGIVFRNDGKGGPQNLHSLGNAVDGAVETFVFESGNYDIDLINSQVVALNHDKANEYINYGRLSASFIVTGENFTSTATFFSGNYWGGGDRLITAAGGTVNLYSSNLATSGSVETLSLENSAKVNFINVNRRTGNKLFSSPGTQEKNCGVFASILNCNSANENRFFKWENNLPISWDFASYDNLLPRNGWKATAFNDASGSGIARYAIDGNSSTRWTTEAAQANGQWFSIDFGKTERLNTLILDTSASPNDGPKRYIVETYEQNRGWREVLPERKLPQL
ncbi:MAG: discoidin domain-containing protein [Muribaculum sp.]|nr:discoidin domain-containing protein [Muribaculum sp.]